MRPLLRRSGPGHCPIFGMSLEVFIPRAGSDEIDPKLRRLWLSFALTLPLLLMAMHVAWPFDLSAWVDASSGELGWHRVASVRASSGLEVLLSTIVVVWGGGPFFVLGWHSFITRQLNMFSLITLGASTAWLFSLYALFWPASLPAAFFAGNEAPLYFEAPAVIVTLVLLGQVLEMRARMRTNAGVKGLLGLAANIAFRVGADGREKPVALDAVVVGDTLRVKPGGKVPVDAASRSVRAVSTRRRRSLSPPSGLPRRVRARPGPDGVDARELPHRPDVAAGPTVAFHPRRPGASGLQGRLAGFRIARVTACPR